MVSESSELDSIDKIFFKKWHLPHLNFTEQSEFGDSGSDIPQHEWEDWQQSQSPGRGHFVC